jgi:hypothetical protein
MIQRLAAVRRMGERKTKQKAESRKQKAASQSRRRSHLPRAEGRGQRADGGSAGALATGLLIILNAEKLKG